MWQPSVRVGGEVLAWVSKFKYLGSMFHDTSSLDFDLARRIQLAATAFRALERPFFRRHCIPLGTRMLVYTAMVVSVLLYGCEAWAPTAAQLHHLEVFHRQRLRLILGVRAADRLSNDALYQRCRSPPLLSLIERRQLLWLAHLCRMPDHRIAKQALYSTMAAPGRSRKVGRMCTNLCDWYQRLVRVHLNRQRLRAAGYSGRASWRDVCMDRSGMKQFLPSNRC
jgi:hypothetical protein